MAKIEMVEKSPEEMKKEAKHRIESTDPDEFKDIFDGKGVPDGKVLVWGNTKREMLEMAKYRDKWEVAEANTAPNLRTVGKQADGTHVIGDAIAMLVPKEVLDRKQREMVETLKARKARSKAELMEMAARMKVKVTDDERS